MDPGLQITGSHLSRQPMTSRPDVTWRPLLSRGRWEEVRHPFVSSRSLICRLNYILDPFCLPIVPEWSLRSQPHLGAAGKSWESWLELRFLRGNQNTVMPALLGQDCVSAFPTRHPGEGPGSELSVTPKGALPQHPGPWRPM